MAYDPYEGFRKAAETYSGPGPSMPARKIVRSEMEPWVLGTEAGPPKTLMAATNAPTDADRANWQNAQAQFARPPQTTDPLNKMLVQTAQAFLPGNVAFALMPEQEKQRQLEIAGRYPLTPRSGERSPAAPVAPAAPRAAPEPLETGLETVGPKLTSVGAGYGVAGANTSGRAGFSNRTYYGPNNDVVASGVSSANRPGGFVGASTDAEAARNLQARFEQDAAASAMAASMNRGAEAMRDLRAAQVADFDGYQRGAPAVPGPSATPNPFSVAGDSFQDTRGRQAEFDRLFQQAATGNRRERQGAQAGLAGIMGIVQGNLGREADRDAAGNERLKALLAQQDRAFDNARADRGLALQERQFQATQDQNRFNRDQAAAQFLRQVDKDAADARKDRLAAGADRQKMVTNDARAFAEQYKDDPTALTRTLQYGQQMLPALAQARPDIAQRIRDGIPTFEDLNMMKRGMDLGRDPTKLYNPFSWFSDAPTPSSVVDQMFPR